jgi:hypothetical protein
LQKNRQSAFAEKSAMRGRCRVYNILAELAEQSAMKKISSAMQITTTCVASHFELMDSAGTCASTQLITADNHDETPRQRLARGSVLVGPVPAHDAVGPAGSCGAKGERGLDGAARLLGQKSENAGDPGPAPGVPRVAAVAPGSVAAALGNFTALELEKIIPVPEAAGLNNQHEDTFRRNFSHLVRKVGKRKTGVKLRDAITLPPAPVDAV